MALFTGCHSYCRITRFLPFPLDFNPFVLRFDFTIDQDLAYQSYQALTLLFRFLAEHKVPEQERFCPPSPILSAELVPDTE